MESFAYGRQVSRLGGKVRFWAASFEFGRRVVAFGRRTLSLGGEFRVWAASFEFGRRVSSLGSEEEVSAASFELWSVQRLMRCCLNWIRLDPLLHHDVAPQFLCGSSSGCLWIMLGAPLSSFCCQQQVMFRALSVECLCCHEGKV